MKIIVLGDIHGKNCWKDIVKQHFDADKYIFLGDYVSTHEDISSEVQCINLRAILDFKTANPDKVILLRGNHDMQHLGYSWASCSGYDRVVGNYMYNIKDEFLSKTQWVYIYENIVFSHAGVSEVWMENLKLDNIEDINKLEPSEKFGFWPCKMSDYSGDSCTQPPTWIRPWTLVEYSFGNYTYIVGHTRYHGDIINIKEECIKNYKAGWLFDENDEYSKKVIDRYSNANDIYCCDALPNKYLVIENGNISIMNN
jgi:hypothetical protein